MGYRIGCKKALVYNICMYHQYHHLTLFVFSIISCMYHQQPPSNTIFLLQTSRDPTNNNKTPTPTITPTPSPSQPTPPASPGQPPQSRRLLQDTLARQGPYPLIVTPGRGYWVDGTDHECSYDHRGNAVLPHGAWRAKIETDDTAKCYRRFFVGRVSVYVGMEGCVRMRRHWVPKPSCMKSSKVRGIRIKIR